MFMFIVIFFFLEDRSRRSASMGLQREEKAKTSVGHR